MTRTPDTLSIPQTLFEEARAHAADTYPAECCGILVGRIEGAVHRVVEIHAAENARDEEHRHNRYLIPPQLVARVLHDASRRGLDVVGYYHSHPDHPCRPSVFDREHAWPNTSYLIYSVFEGEPADAKSWRLLDDRSDFEEEIVQQTDSDQNPVSLIHPNESARQSAAPQESDA